MHISLNWLKKYTQIPETLSPKALGEKITLHIAEVEEVVSEAEKFAHMVVGKILTMAPHPDADKLRITTVDIGTNTPINIVCGAPNITEGMLVPVAMLGARVRWHGEGDLVTLGKTKIRGIESEGMISAGIELGIEGHFPETDPMDIPNFEKFGKPAGTPLAEIFEATDIILEVDNKSLTHRPDLFGHYGFARECATLFNTELKPLVEKEPTFPKGKEGKIAITSEHVRRFGTILIEGITVTASPSWLREAVEKVGIRSINNIVDLTNYLMLDTGHPMHAFDADKLSGDALTIGHPKAPISFITLDGKERTITEEMLALFDGEKPVALATLMGGQDTEVHEGTTRILLEAANCDPTVVRKAAQKLGLRTDASSRAEKNLDPELLAPTLKKAAALILELCPEAKIASSFTDAYPKPFPEITLTITHADIEKRVGMSFTKEFIINTLTGLEFAPKESKGTYTLTVPSHRRTKDVSMNADIIEEIARMQGYDNIPKQVPAFPLGNGEQKKDVTLEERLRSFCAKELALEEVFHYSFVSEEEQRTTKLDPIHCVRIMNPLSEDQSLLRTSLLPGLLKGAKGNVRYVSQFSVFEWGHTYEKKEGSVWNSKEDHSNETRRLGILLLTPKTKRTPETELFFTGKALLTKLGKTLFGATPQFQEQYEKYTGETNWVHPGKAAIMMLQGKAVGLIGALHPQVLGAWDLSKYDVLAIELNAELLIPMEIGKKKYTRLPKYPEVERELSLLFPEATTYKTIEDSVKKSTPLLKSFGLLEVYRDSAHIGEGQKSMSFRFALGDAEKTLSEEDIQAGTKQMLEALTKVGGTLRTV